MTAPPRAKCPTSDLWGDRHLVTDRRWTLTTPEGVETVLCSAACTVSCKLGHMMVDTYPLDRCHTREIQAATVGPGPDH